MSLKGYCSAATLLQTNCLDDGCENDSHSTDENCYTTAPLMADDVGVVRYEQLPSFAFLRAWRVSYLSRLVS